MADTGLIPRSTADDIYSPATGRIVLLDDVPDEMFADRILGDGFAVEPIDGIFRAPIAGELIVVARTLHAFAIRSNGGVEVLVHIGIDTVNLAGAGFTAKRAVCEHVDVGDEIIVCDLPRVADKVTSMVSPVVVTNGKSFTVTSVNVTAEQSHPVAAVSRAN